MINNQFKRKGPPFGIKLELLGKEHNLKNAAEIANALYKNDTCFLIIKPGKRDFKDPTEDAKNRDCATLAKRVQDHIQPTTEAEQVDGKYMLAYSVLFDCSLDFLYGKIDEPTPNAEVFDICKKTGLSSKAVSNLMSNNHVYLESFLYQHFEYEFLYSNIDPEASISVTKFWSDILESELFNSLPESWSEMACALELHKATEQRFQALDRRKPNLPSREEFFKIVDEYYATHGDDPCMGDDPFDIFDKDKDRAMAIMREISDEESENAFSDKGKAKTIYWGCAGIFNRMIGNYFHKLADNFEIPTFNVDDTNEQ